jgi:hypothetical protein
MWLQRLLTCCALTIIAFSVQAFERPFPETAKRGKMSPAVYPTLVIDGTTRRLSGGGRIWNSDNLIQMPATIQGGAYIVNYTETLEGDIDRVWILTEEEARKPAPKKPR